MGDTVVIKTEQEIIGLYTSSNYTIISKPEVLNADDDFREVYIIECDGLKIVVKHTSNTFTDDNRMLAIIKLTEIYRELGIYCPKIIPDATGELYSKYIVNDREYFIYAEEFAKYEIAENVGKDKFIDNDKVPLYFDEMYRSLGRVAAANIDVADCPSAYCLLKPFCPHDTVDEQTECAELFFNYIYENIPDFKNEADEVKALFYEVKSKIAEVYYTLPTSCFQSDLSCSNVLLDENGNFAGLIDFNLCGKNVNINHLTRAAHSYSIYEEGDYLTLDEYEEHHQKEISLFMRKMRCISETYHFTKAEREIFPLIFNYQISIWWDDVEKIKRIHEDKQKVSRYLSWIKKRLTRKDVKLPQGGREA